MVKPRPCLEPEGPVWRALGWGASSRLPRMRPRRRSRRVRSAAERSGSEVGRSVGDDIGRRGGGGAAGDVTARVFRLPLPLHAGGRGLSRLGRVLAGLGRQAAGRTGGQAGAASAPPCSRGSHLAPPAGCFRGKQGTCRGSCGSGLWRAARSTHGGGQARPRAERACLAAAARPPARRPRTGSRAPGWAKSRWRDPAQPNLPGEAGRFLPGSAENPGLHELWGSDWMDGWMDVHFTMFVCCNRPTTKVFLNSFPF